jgi:hypothetical protein
MQRFFFFGVNIIGCSLLVERKSDRIRLFEARSAFAGILGWCFSCRVLLLSGYGARFALLNLGPVQEAFCTRLRCIPKEAPVLRGERGGGGERWTLDTA